MTNDGRETRVHGFKENGWDMPVGFKLHPVPVNDDDAKRYINIMRDCMTMASKPGAKYDCKDVLFAFNTASVFVVALMLAKKIELRSMVAIGLRSDTGMTGRTQILRTLTTIWWGFPHDTCAAYDLCYVSRIFDFLTHGTFPVFIDDIDQISPSNLATIKETLKPIMVKDMKTGSKPSMAERIGRPIYTTFSETNPRDLSGTVLVIHVNTTITKPDFVKFQEIYKIPRGAIGGYIYQKTAGWNIDDVSTRYAATPDHPRPSGATSNALYKLIHLGAALFKEFFGIELNVEHCEDLIDESISTNEKSD
jgi:hypothetical protein